MSFNAFGWHKKKQLSKGPNPVLNKLFLETDKQLKAYPKRTGFILNNFETIQNYLVNMNSVLSFFNLERILDNQSLNNNLFNDDFIFWQQ